MKSLMLLVQSELRRSGYEELIAAGIVLTGGSSKVMGLIDLAEEIFHMPVRMGVPQNVNGLTEVVKNPIHSTGVGLLMYGREHQGGTRSVDTEDLGFFAKVKKLVSG